MAGNSYTSKKKAFEAAAWLNQPPHPLPILRKGTQVTVFRGAGWSKGVVIESTKDGCTVKVDQTGQSIRVYDRRNIKEA